MSTAELELQPEAALDPTRVRRWKRYPAYRDSGVEWLGEVPAHWRSLLPLRPLEEIEAEIKQIEGEILEMLQEVTG